MFCWVWQGRRSVLAFSPPSPHTFNPVPPPMLVLFHCCRRINSGTHRFLHLFLLFFSLLWQHLLSCTLPMKGGEEVKVVWLNGYVRMFTFVSLTSCLRTWRRITRSSSVWVIPLKFVDCQCSQVVTSKLVQMASYDCDSGKRAGIPWSDMLMA